MPGQVSSMGRFLVPLPRHGFGLHRVGISLKFKKFEQRGLHPSQGFLMTWVFAEVVELVRVVLQIVESELGAVMKLTHEGVVIPLGGDP